jgi:hypothetical protein
MITKRNLTLSFVLFATLWLTWLSYNEDRSVQIVQPARAMNSEKQPTGKDVQLALKLRESSKSTVDLFYTPPRKSLSQAKVVETKAVAPALPFKYLGRMRVGGDNSVMLVVQGDVTPIQQGEVLLGQYKVMEINESSSSLQIKFLYLPLNQIQTLSAQIDN